MLFIIHIIHVLFFLLIIIIQILIAIEFIPMTGSKFLYFFQNICGSNKLLSELFYSHCDNFVFIFENNI